MNTKSEIQAKFINEGATLIIDGCEGRIAVDVIKENADLCTALFLALSPSPPAVEKKGRPLLTDGWLDDNAPPVQTDEKSASAPRVVPFDCLAIGARFRYIGRPDVWVKMDGRGTITLWDDSQLTTHWLGQQICSLNDDGDMRMKVEIAEVPATVPLAVAEKLLQELQNIADAKPSTWGDMRDQFKPWAQNRARAAITAFQASTKE